MEKLSWAQIFSRGEGNVSQAANCILTVMLEERARGPPESVGFNRGKTIQHFLALHSLIVIHYQ